MLEEDSGPGNSSAEELLRQALLRRDFGAFEDALAVLADRGFVLKGGG